MKKNAFLVALLCLFSFTFFNSCTPSDDDFIEVVGDDGQENPQDGGGNDGGSDDGETSTDQTLTAYFKSNAEYSILSTAIEQIGFSAALDNPSSYTFFAPDNAAFNRYLAKLGVNDVRNINTSLLTQIVQYHMLSGRKTIAEINTGYTASLAKEFSTQANVHMYITNTGSAVRINGISEINNANIQATNGTIHKVTEVLELPSITTFILADPQFNEFAMVARRGNNTQIFELLSSMENDFTFLGANDGAFDALLTELNYQDTNEIPEVTLLDILENHIHLNSIKRQNNLSNNLTLVMKNENTVTFTNTNGMQFSDENNRKSNLITANIQAWNGVIHAIDKVLLPKE